MATDTNYADALKAATAWAEEHIKSEAHRAALDAFFADEPPREREQEALLRKIFGHAPLDDRHLRREAARGAADSVLRAERLAEKRARSAAALAEQRTPA